MRRLPGAAAEALVRLCVPELSGRGGARTPHEQGALLGHPDELASLQAWLVGPGLQGPHTDARRLWVAGQAVCPHLRADLSSGEDVDHS